MSSYRVCCRAATPHVRIVNDVVVQQRGGMDEFDHRSQFVMMPSGVAACAGRQDYKRRPQPFAAAAYDVVGHLPDEDHVGLESIANDAVNLAHVVGNQVLDDFRDHELGRQRCRRQKARW